MFKTVVMDLNAIYQLARQPTVTDLGTTHLDNSEHAVYTFVHGVGSDFVLCTEAELNLKKKEALPLEETMSQLLPSFNLISRGETQLIMERQGVLYVIDRAEKGGSITVRTSLPEIGEFDVIMDNYAQVVDTLITCFFNQKNTPVPQLSHYVGRTIDPDSIPDSEKEYTASDTSNTTTPTVNSELERKIILPDPHVELSDIGGCTIGKDAIREIYHDFIHPLQAAFCGRDPKRMKGYLLLGKEGCGKTLLVKALATLLYRNLSKRIKFYAVSYSQITSIYRGGEAQATAEVFDLVAANERKTISTLLFLDELHLIGRRTHGNVKDEALDTLLTKLGGVESYKHLTIIGATNQLLETLDPALVREGRLGQHIHIPDPDEIEREAIFQIYFDKMIAVAKEAGNEHVAEVLDLAEIAKAAIGYKGNDIEGLVRSVIRNKEKEVRSRIGDDAANNQFCAAFTPITTADVLRLIKDKRTKQIGFKS